MKIGLICDMHLPADARSPQHAFFMRAAGMMHSDGIQTVFCLGDITSYGQPEALGYYLNTMSGFDGHFVLGNSDVRNPDSRAEFTALATDVEMEISGRKIMCINTPFAQISVQDKMKISHLSDGDILCLHHAFHGLEEESRTYLERVAQQKALIIIHAHAHRWFDYELGLSRVIGLRALDPDKSIGDFPCITYFDIGQDDISFEERLVTLPTEMILDARNYFGMSCVDNHRDVAYAVEHGVSYIELRCNGADWMPDMTLLPEIDLWRQKGGRYLSVHMPNVRWNNGALVGMQTWYQAAEYAKMVGTQGLTMHPPRVKKADMTRDGAAWKEFLKLYTDVVGMMGDEVKIGIENLHMEPDERDDESRGFGCNPEEVLSWMDAINRAIGKENRVGHTLDVGHARNNGSISEGYPISRWYEQMGDKTVAYHIHQVVPRSEGGLKNHQAIEDWFGPVISYVSFFHAWGERMINHFPVFLEVGGCESFDRSIRAFEEAFCHKRSIG